MVKRSISNKDALKQSKARAILDREYLKQVRASDPREVKRLSRLLSADTQTVEELTGLIEQEQIYLAKLIEPIARGIEDEISKARVAQPPSNPATEFRNLMEVTTCFVGEGPYVKK